jgi:hypothetical protein
MKGQLVYDQCPANDSRIVSKEKSTDTGQTNQHIDEEIASYTRGCDFAIAMAELF